METEKQNEIIRKTTHDNFYETYWQARGKMKMKSRYYIFASWIEPGSRVLDIGGGDGVLGEFLRDK